MKKGILHNENPSLKLGMIGGGADEKTELTSAIIKTLAKNKTYDSKDIYDARIVSSPRSEKHVTLVANSLNEAEKILEEEFGKGAVSSIRNRKDAEKPRR